MEVCCGSLASSFEGFILGDENCVSVLYKIKGLLATTFMETDCKNVKFCETTLLVSK